MRKLLILICISSFLVFSCKKEDFRYESEWLSPVLKTSLGISDLKFDDYLKSNQDGTVDLVFNYSETVDSLLEILDVPDSLSEVSFSLTQLVLDDRSFTDTLTLLEMYPPSILLNGKTTILEAQDITTNQGTVLDVTEQFFKTATFKEGFLDITIHNDLPVEAELIEFELLNNDDKSVVVSGSFMNLLPFATDSQSFSLAGKTVDGILEARIKRIKTKESDSAVLIDVSKGLRIELSVHDLKPQSATAIFPAQNLIEKEEETVYNFGGPNITVMRLRGGFVTMTVYSTIEEEIILEYEIPFSKHVVSKEKIHKIYKIPPSQNGVPSKITEKFPIGEYEIQYKGKDPTMPPFTNTFYSLLNARIEYTGIERSISLSDSIYVQFGLIDVVPELAIGGFGQKNYDFDDSIELGVFKDMTGELNLEDASLQLNFLNSFGIEAFMDVREIVGVNNRTGKTVALSTTAFGVPFYLQRGKNIGLSVVPFQYTFFLDKGNSNIKQFLENLPDVIKTKFGVQTEPYWHNNYTDFAFYDSYLKANLELHVPLDLGMKDLRLIKTSPFVLSEPNLQKVQRGNFKLKVKNGYPWEMGAVLEFLDDQGNVIAILGTSEDQKIRPAVVSGSTGRVEGVTETLINMPVTEEKMQWIKNASQIRVSSTFNTDQGKRFKIYSNYKMDIQLIADFVYEN